MKNQMMMLLGGARDAPQKNKSKTELSARCSTTVKVVQIWILFRMWSAHSSFLPRSGQTYLMATIPRQCQGSSARVSTIHCRQVWNSMTGGKRSSPSHIHASFCFSVHVHFVQIVPLWYDLVPFRRKMLSGIAFCMCTD